MKNDSQKEVLTRLCRVNTEFVVLWSDQSELCSSVFLELISLVFIYPTFTFLRALETWTISISNFSVCNVAATTQRSFLASAELLTAVRGWPSPLTAVNHLWLRPLPWDEPHFVPGLGLLPQDRKYSFQIRKADLRRNECQQQWFRGCKMAAVAVCVWRAAVTHAVAYGLCVSSSLATDPALSQSVPGTHN